MGLFGKIKENLNHGGVKLQLSAPASVSMQDASVPVTVNVTGGSEPQTINGIDVTIWAESRNQAFSTTNTSSQVDRHQVAEANYAQPFIVLPGETKSVQLSVVMNAGEAVASQLPEGSGMAQIAQAFQKLQAVSETLNHDSYTYSIATSAKIEGVTFGPSHEQPIQVLKPGEIGTGFNLNL